MKSAKSALSVVIREILSFADDVRDAPYGAPVVMTFFDVPPIDESLSPP
jgi:hypothetical protein